MPAPSLLDVATLAVKTLANALPNTSPDAFFSTIGDDTLRYLNNLVRLFTAAITTTVSPVPDNTAPTLLAAPSPRVISSLSLAPVVTSHPLSPRVVPVYTPPLRHLIAPEDNTPVPRRCYPLCSRPRLALSEHGPHLISSTAHHCRMRPIYLHPTTLLANYVIATIMQGFVNLTEQVPS